MTQAVEYHTDTSDMLIPHGMFRTSLATAGPIIAAASRGDAERTATVASYLDNVLRFLDAHHGGEDAVVWPVLAERSPQAAQLLARMQGQHAAIHELREKAGTALTAWTASGSAEDGRTLASALAASRRDRRPLRRGGGRDPSRWPRGTCPRRSGAATRSCHAALHGRQGVAPPRPGVRADDGRAARRHVAAHATARHRDVALATALANLAAEIDVHFGEEEAEILPVASRYMAPEEWGQLPGHAMQHFTGDRIWLILGLVFEQMTPEQLATTLQHLPAPVTEMWAGGGRARFEEFIARVRVGS